MSNAIDDGEEIDLSPDTRTFVVTAVSGALICAYLFFANPIMPMSLDCVIGRTLTTVPGPWQYVNAAVLLWLPLTLILLMLRQSPAQFGMMAGDRRLGLKWLAIGLAVMIPLVAFVSRLKQFHAYYDPHLAMYSQSWLALVDYELSMGFYFFCWEWFFRGYLLFGLARLKPIGIWGAIILQTIPFTLLHWSLDPAAAKPPVEIITAIPGGLLLGFVAYRTRSFFYGFLIHWGISLTLDLLVVAPVLMHAR